MLLLVAALPLRGYAASIKALCEAHHGASQAAHQMAHEHGADHEHDPDASSGDRNHAGLTSLCSLCSTCSVGTPLVAEAARPLVQATSPGSARIPFVTPYIPGVLPEHPDRPPLAS